MKDLFEPGEGESRPDATKSARQAARPVLRSRFFKEVGTSPVPEGFAVVLDGRPVRTPAGRTLAVPRHPIAHALRGEWDAQAQTIDPARMPLTRLANAIIDGLAERQDEAVADIVNYLSSDLLFYRADGPPGLVEKQAAIWDPIIRWAADDLGARFMLAEGIVHVAQPAPAIAAARAAIPADGWVVGPLHSITTLTGSALLALALLRNFADADAVWRAAHVDEDWNFQTWGFDDLALERRKAREAEFRVAALVLAAM